MRWHSLFADLDGQLAAAGIAQRAAEVDDRARAEVGRIRLVDRLRPAVGQLVRVRCRGGVTITGALTGVGSEWLLLDEGGNREALVVTAMVISVSGLGRLSAVPGSEGVVESRLGLCHALRGIVRDRSAASVILADATTADGTIDRVGSDFIEVAAHAPGELRRRSDVRDVLVVPIGAILVVRRMA